MIRLFVAIPVESPAVEELGALLERWQGHEWPVKWVRREGLHLTLKFLGSVEESVLGPLQSALSAAVAGTPQLSFTLTELGAFPSFRKAQVLWAGLESEPALELLVHRIEQECEVLGFPVEGRAYRPHVTLGRVRQGRALGSAARELLESTGLAPVSFTSTQAILYQSLTGPGGSRYQARATFPLGT